MPTAPKCCKKHYEIKIFFSHDQNMTKNVPHARRANHDQELTKTAKKHKQKHFQSMPTAQKCCKKKSRNNIFVWSDEKSLKTSKKVTLSRSPHSSKILKKKQYRMNMFVLRFEKAFTHRMQARCSPRHKFHNKN